MGRGNIRRRISQPSRDNSRPGQHGGVYVDVTKLKRERPNQDEPPTLPNIDVNGILFAIIMIVFVFYPLAQAALGL